MTQSKKPLSLIRKAGAALLAFLLVLLTVGCEREDEDRVVEKDTEKTLIAVPTPSPTPGIDTLTGGSEDAGVLLNNGFVYLEICSVKGTVDEGYTVTARVENNEQYPVYCAVLDICINGVLCSSYEEFSIETGEAAYKTIPLEPNSIGGDPGTPEELSFTLRVMTDDRAQDLLYTFTKCFALKDGVPSSVKNSSSYTTSSVSDLEGTPLFTSNKCSLSVVEAGVSEDGGYRMQLNASNGNSFPVSVYLTSAAMDGIVCPSSGGTSIPAGASAYFTVEWAPDTLFYYGVSPETIGTITLDVSILKTTDTVVKTLTDISVRYEAGRTGRELDLSDARCLMTTADVAVYAIGLEEYGDVYAMRLCAVSHSDKTVGIRITDASVSGYELDSASGGTLPAGMMLMPCIQWDKSEVDAEGTFTATVTVVDAEAPDTALNTHTISVNLNSY